MKRDQIDERAVVLRRRAASDLYFLAKGILGYADLSPSIHSEIANRCHPAESIRNLTLIARDHLKTTLRTISRIVQQSIIQTEKGNFFTLLAMDTQPNAGLKGNEIRSHWERNAMLRSLYPELAPNMERGQRWNTEIFELVNTRTGFRHEVHQIGVSGGATSRHFHEIIIDDAVTEDASKSKLVMDSAINWFKKAEDLLVDPERNVIEVVGTRWVNPPWTSYDLYDYILDNYPEYHLYFRPAITTAGMEIKVPGGKKYFFCDKDRESGVPVWPERFSRGYFDQKKIREPFVFACQQMLNPVDPSMLRFSLDSIPQFQWAQQDNDILLIPLRLDGTNKKDSDGNNIYYALSDCNVVASTDPASSENASACKRAIAVVATAPMLEGMISPDRFILYSWSKVCPESEYIAQMFNVQTAWSPSVFGVESNANQSWLKSHVENVSRMSKIFIPTAPIMPSMKTKKLKRIEGRLEPLFRNQELHYDPRDTVFVDAIMNYPRDGVDYLDALEDCVELWSTPTEATRMEELPHWLNSPVSSVGY